MLAGGVYLGGLGDFGSRLVLGLGGGCVQPETLNPVTSGIFSRKGLLLNIWHSTRLRV